MKIFLAVFSFLFSFIGVAIVVGIVMIIVFPPSGSRAFVGVGIGWRNLPGTLLGLWAGIHSARVALRNAEHKARKRDEGPAS